MHVLKKLAALEKFAIKAVADFPPEGYTMQKGQISIKQDEVLFCDLRGIQHSKHEKGFYGAPWPVWRYRNGKKEQGQLKGQWFHVECKMCSTKNKVECHNKCSVPRKRQNKGLHPKFLDFAFKACPKCIQKTKMKSFISYFYNTRATETTKKGLISEFDKYHSAPSKYGPAPYFGGLNPSVDPEWKEAKRLQNKPLKEWLPFAKRMLSASMQEGLRDMILSKHFDVFLNHKDGTNVLESLRVKLFYSDDVCLS